MRMKLLDFPSLSLWHCGCDKNKFSLSDAAAGHQGSKCGHHNGSQNALTFRAHRMYAKCKVTELLKKGTWMMEALRTSKKGNSLTLKRTVSELCINSLQLVQPLYIRI